ncbi:MAG: glycosyltransferase family 39 protein [Crocinitomicaceae bacterium]
MLGLIAPVLIMDGMFMDGVLYASVSHNLANGYGSLWFLKFSELGFAEHLTFHEHPPLVFWIQAFFFKILGDSMYVERFYSLLTAFITAWLIFKSWKLIHREDQKIAQFSWLAVFLWMFIPVSFWSFQNNVMENTMGLFVMGSFYFTFKALHYQEKIFQFLLISSIFIFLATFSKGVPGFFPLVVPFFHWAVFKKYSFIKMTWYSIILVIVPIAIYGLLMLIPSANESLSIYFFDRLLGRTTSKPTVDHRYWILIRLFMEILPLIIIVAVSWGVMKWRKIELNIFKKERQLFTFLFLVGVSGSVPIMLTMVQKPFYFSPSLPFFGMAFAMLLAPGLSTSFERIKVDTKGYKIFRSFTLLCLAAVIVATIMQIGKVSRNPEVVHDMYIVADVTGEHSTIGVHEKMWNEWDMHCYMVRYWNISWDYHADIHHEYYLMNRTLGIQPDSLYEKIDLPTVRYDLYKLKE